MVPGIQGSRMCPAFIMQQRTERRGGSPSVHGAPRRTARRAHSGLIHCRITDSRWSGSTGLVT
ncbi:hypothetical protein ACE1SV_47800 [Streptomyces sp. E-15]